jgi:hypothetical protein
VGKGNERKKKIKEGRKTAIKSPAKRNNMYFNKKNRK